ncbi:MAG: alpha/beta fold hydrolase, partial [Proteobacteria bacterium]|nr:alpha/beta fold hydrolase [Pseudomonadota bacterium]
HPVVFHHGIGTDHHIWTDWLPPIISSHICVAFDTRGYGASSIPAEGHRFTLEGALGDLMEMVNFASGGPVHLVGESFGGTICLLAAIRHPERVASVTVSNTAFKGSGIAYVAGWRETFARQGPEAWSRDMMQKRFYDGALDEARWRWFHELQSRSPAHVTAGLGELLATTDLGPELDRLKAPLLILSPDGSPFVTTPMAVELHRRVKGSELAVFPGTRHGLPFSHGNECGALLARHLARVEAARS